MTVQDALCTKNRRYRAAEPLRPQGVVLHSIGTPQKSAQAMVRYWQRDASPYLTHFVLDDAAVYRCMPETYKCWHVGAPGNAQYLGIEMCEPDTIRYTAGASFQVQNLAEAQRYARACYQNAVQLIAQLCEMYGWDPQKAVWTHGEITRRGLSNTDHVDPEHLWNGLGLGLDLQRLRSDVQRQMAAQAAAPLPEKPEPSGEGETLYRIRKSWQDVKSQIGAYRSLELAKAACEDGYTVYDEAGQAVYAPSKAQPEPESFLVRITAEHGLNVRGGPGTGHSVQQTLARGGVYTVVEEADGWGLLKAYAAGRDGWIFLRYTERLP